MRTDPKSMISEANSTVQHVPIDDLYYTRSSFGAAWSPNGNEIVLITDMSGRLNLWKVKASGGWPLQLTQSDDREFSAAWSPDGKWIVYQQDSGGNEMWDLFAVPSDGGEVVNLTNTPNVREESPLWSPDGNRLVLGYKPKESTVYDLAILDWKTRAVRKLTNEETKNRSWSAVSWSPDGKTLYAVRSEISGESESDIYSVDTSNRKIYKLTPPQPTLLFHPTPSSP